MVRKTQQQTGERRAKQFKKWTSRVTADEVLMPPLYLGKEERRLYIRATLKEDHTQRIQNKPEATEAKFKKLRKSFFQFFRGTALLYYRDYAGIDHNLPVVFTIGDVHPGNFGVMPNSDNVPFFSVNDFDEAYFAPFSWDIRRGATGFWLSARENGHSKKKCRKIVRAFVTGYMNGLREFSRDDREKFFQYRIDNSPKRIKKLLENSLESRAEFLKEKISLKKRRFKVSDEIVPYTQHIKKFQKIVDTYVEENEISIPRGDEEYFRVEDVAVKKGSGTASLGLDRFWVLIRGESATGDDCRILEMKQARTSALSGLVPKTDYDDMNNRKSARQIVKAHRVHLAGGDIFYGYAQRQGKMYLVRERSPYKDDIDLDELSGKTFKKYARICGKALSQTHARSDEDAGLSVENAEESILGSIICDVFVDDMVRFAGSSAQRVIDDHALFVKDFDLGVFQLVGS